MNTLTQGKRKVKRACRTNGNPTLSRRKGYPGWPTDPALWPDPLDAWTWELGPEPTPYEPSEEESRWQSETTGGGCSPVELSPSEVAMEAGTLSAFDYWRKHLDPAIDDPSEQLA